MSDACPGLPACEANPVCQTWFDCLGNCPIGADCFKLCPVMEAIKPLANPVLECFEQLGVATTGLCHATCIDEGAIGCSQSDCIPGEVCRRPDKTSEIKRCLPPAALGETCAGMDDCQAGFECAFKSGTCVAMGQAACESDEDCSSFNCASGFCAMECGFELDDCDQGSDCCSGVCDPDGYCVDVVGDDDAAEDFFCENGDAIPSDWVCDDFEDCDEGSDEANC